MTLFAWRASQCSPLLGLTSSSVGRTERRPEVKSEISTYPGLSLVIKHSATPAQAIKIQLNSGFVILFICRKELQQLCIARYTQSQSVTVQSSQASQFLKRKLFVLPLGGREVCDLQYNIGNNYREFKCKSISNGYRCSGGNLK